MRFDFHPLTVRAVERQTPDAVSVAFDLPETINGAFDFKPGQYVTLRKTIDGEELRRTYSICSQPGEQQIRVGVKKLDGGQFSTFINEELKAGDVIEVMEPEGRFGITLGGDNAYLLIAAGSGITPMLSIAKTVLTREPGSTVTLIYGNRTSETIMFLEELEDLKDRFLGRFNLIHVLSRESQDVDILSGRIDPERIRDLCERGLIDPKSASSVMLCGPGEMIEDAADTLAALGVDKTAIRVEHFTPAGGKARQVAKSEAPIADHARIEAILDGRRRSFEITDPDNAVIDAAIAAGVDLPFACKGGMCCTCRCKILEGEGEMAVNYSLLDWEIEAGFTLACQTRPTTKKLVLDFDAV